MLHLQARNKWNMKSRQLSLSARNSFKMMDFHFCPEAILDIPKTTPFIRATRLRQQHGVMDLSSSSLWAPDNLRGEKSNESVISCQIHTSYHLTGDAYTQTEAWSLRCCRSFTLQCEDDEVMMHVFIRFWMHSAAPVSNLRDFMWWCFLFKSDSDSFNLLVMCYFSYLPKWKPRLFTKILRHSGYTAFTMTLRHRGHTPY